MKKKSHNRQLRQRAAPAAPARALGAARPPQPGPLAPWALPGGGRDAVPGPYHRAPPAGGDTRSRSPPHAPTPPPSASPCSELPPPFLYSAWAILAGLLLLPPPRAANGTSRGPPHRCGRWTEPTAGEGVAPLQPPQPLPGGRGQPAGCVLGLRRPPGTAAPGGVGAGARYPEQRFVCGHPPRPSSKTFPFLSVVPTCRLITPAQPAFPLAAATVGAGRPPLREPACCGLLSPAPGLLAGFVGPCGARRGAASPRGVRR
eukprot:XP_027311576.1 basic proline-rich protein-like isoform X1 [Anas platyrhynchos]